jgi:hypothetical protein
MFIRRSRVLLERKGCRWHGSFVRRRKNTSRTGGRFLPAPKVSRDVWTTYRQTSDRKSWRGFVIRTRCRSYSFASFFSHSDTVIDFTPRICQAVRTLFLEDAGRSFSYTVVFGTDMRTAFWRVSRNPDWSFGFQNWRAIGSATRELRKNWNAGDGRC